MADREDAYLRESSSGNQTEYHIKPEILEQLDKLCPMELCEGLIAVAKKCRNEEIKDCHLTEEEAEIAIRQIDKYKEHNLGEHCEQEYRNVEEVCDILMEVGVPLHYTTTASHRLHLKYVLDLLLIFDLIGKHRNDLLHEAIHLHDWSKYGPKEAIGYGIMFGYNKKFRILNQQEKEFWEKSLKFHLTTNSHHPQFYDGSDSEKQPMDEVARLESIIDMMACTMERNLSKKFGILQLFEIDDKYLERYTAKDKCEVKKFYQDCIDGVIQKLKSSADDLDFKFKISSWEKKTGKMLIQL